jgi:hypothetical protein
VAALPNELRVFEFQPGPLAEVCCTNHLISDLLETSQILPRCLLRYVRPADCMFPHCTRAGKSGCKLGYMQQSSILGKHTHVTFALQSVKQPTSLLVRVPMSVAQDFQPLQKTQHRRDALILHVLSKNTGNSAPADPSCPPVQGKCICLAADVR